MLAIDSKKIEKFKKKLDKRFKDVMSQASDKVTDVTGAKLKLLKPDYVKQIEKLKEDNLKYIKDLTKDQRKKAIQVLEKGFKQGKNYGDVSKDLVSQIRHMTKERAKLISSTEMNKATANAMKQTLKKNNIQNYFYVTAKDERVSDICNVNSYGNKEGYGNMRKHRIGQGPVPVTDSHPRCRCVIVAAK